MNNNTTPMDQFTVVTNKTTAIDDIQLVELEGLQIHIVTTVYNETYRVNPRTLKRNRYPVKKEIADRISEWSFLEFIKVTPEELQKYRDNGTPSFVLKNNDELFYTSVPEDLNFSVHNIVGAHKCAIPWKECRRLSAATDEEGGCAKVRAYASYIERYPWITFGFETFNTINDSLVVGNCLHYEKCPPTKKFSTKERVDIKLKLASYVWDDVTSIQQINERKLQNRLKYRNKRRNRYK